MGLGGATASSAPFFRVSAFLMVEGLVLQWVLELY